MKNQVYVTLPKRKLERSDVEFLIKQDNFILGTLKISNGSLVWFPKNTSIGKKVDWSEFDKLMVNNAIKTERR